VRKLSSRKVLAGAAGLALVAGGLALAPYALAKEGPIVTDANETHALHTDDFPSAMELARREAREKAIAGVLTGKYQAVQKGGSTVVDLGPNSTMTLPESTSLGTKADDDKPHGGFLSPRYVEIAREKTDKIFTILVEFGSQLPAFPLDPAAQRHEGPLHNEIPEPDRSVDNSTVWRSDFSQAYFNDLYFGGGESLKNYMEAQSSGRYSVNGTVTDWVFVNFTQGRYGTDLCGSIVCSTVLALVRDASKKWVQDRLAGGMTMAQVQTLLGQHDVWDRYDINQNGNFDEPDGFLDHFQIVHAGGDQADGDPIYASDAIWSHRSYSNLAFGPTCNDPEPASGTICITGTPVGGTVVAGQITNPDNDYTGFLIGDYTMQPENGGRSVFYHEYAHDLGLPDDYNIISGGDNNNEHWTLMAQSRLGAMNDGGIGERGGDLGAWNKLQLGWLDYEVVDHDELRLLLLGPQEYNSNLPQALIVTLPDQHVTFDMGAPAEGTMQFYSGHADDSTVTMTRQITVPAGGQTLTFQSRWDIETDWDAAFVTIDGDPVVGTVNGQPTEFDPPNQNGLTVGWDNTQATYVPASFNLPEGTYELGVGYFADAAVAGNDPNQLDGVFVDDFKVDGVALDEAGWDLHGFTHVGATRSQAFEHFYIAGYRSYVSYDQYLKTGPYYFGYNPTFPDKVDHYSYQEGLLISYTNTLYNDNDTFAHPGFGRNLYIDAHPAPMQIGGGTTVPLYGPYWRPRIQVYDAVFGNDRADTVNIHHAEVLRQFGGLAGVNTFDDTKKYFYDELPSHGVKTPGVGVKIRVVADFAGRMLVLVY
jgi:immune inhibitor A